MQKKAATNSDMKGIYKDMKRKWEHEKLKHKLDQGDLVTQTLNSLTAHFLIKEMQ